eukprot:853230_1
MTEKLMKQMQNGELENIDPLGLNSGQALTGIKDDDDEPLEEVNTLVTESMIEEVILDFIVVKDGQTKQSVLDEIYKYDYTQYLKITKGFLDDKGITSLLEPVSMDIEVDNDSDSEDNKEDKSDSYVAENAGCLLALNGRIFSHIMGEFNVYTLLGVLMEE